MVHEAESILWIRIYDVKHGARKYVLRTGVQLACLTRERPLLTVHSMGLMNPRTSVTQSCLLFLLDSA